MHPKGAPPPGGSGGPQKDWKTFFDTPEGFADLDENLDCVQFQLGDRFRNWKYASYTSSKTDPAGNTHFYFLQGVHTYIAPWSKKLSELLTHKVSMWPVYLHTQKATQGNKLSASDIYVLTTEEADIKIACDMYLNFRKTDTHIKIHNEIYTNTDSTSCMLGRIKFEGKSRRLQVFHTPFKGSKMSSVAELPFPFDMYETVDFKKYSSTLVDNASFCNYKHLGAGQYVTFSIMVMEGKIYPIDLEPVIPLFGRMDKHKGGALVATESWGQTVEGVSHADVSRGHAKLSCGRKFIPIPYRRAFKNSLTPKETPNLIITNDSVSCTEVWGTTPQIQITDLMEALGSNTLFNAITSLLPQELKAETDLRTYIEGEEVTQQLMLTGIRGEYDDVTFEKSTNIFKKFYMDIALGKDITPENFIELRMNPLFKRETNNSLKEIIFMGKRRLHRSHVFSLENQQNVIHTIAHDHQTRCIAVLDGTDAHSIMGEIKLTTVSLSREEEEKTLDLFASSNTAKIRMTQTVANKNLLARFRTLTRDQTFSTYDQKESNNSPMYTYCTIGLMGLTEVQINTLVRDAATHPGFFMMRNAEHSKGQDTVCTVSITTPGAAPYIMAYLQQSVLVRSTRVLGAQIYPLSPTEYQVVIPFRLDKDQLLTFLQEINKCPGSEGKGNLNALVNVVYQKVKYVISTRDFYRASTPVRTRQVYQPSNAVESLNLFIVGFPVCTCTVRLKELMQKGGVTLSENTRMSWLQGQGDPYYTLKIVPDTKEMQVKLHSLPLSTSNWAEYGLSVIPESSCQTERLRLIADLSYKLSHIEPDQSPPPVSILSEAQLKTISLTKLLNLLPPIVLNPQPKVPSPITPPPSVKQGVPSSRVHVHTKENKVSDDGFLEVKNRRNRSSSSTSSLPRIDEERAKPKFSEVHSDEEEKLDSEEEREDMKLEKELKITSLPEGRSSQTPLLTLEKPPAKPVKTKQQIELHINAIIGLLAAKQLKGIADTAKKRRKIIHDYVDSLSCSLTETVTLLQGIEQGGDREKGLFSAYLDGIKIDLQDAEAKGKKKEGDLGVSATGSKKQNLNPTANSKTNEDISKVVGELVETHTSIAVTPKKRKQALYRFCKHLALTPEACLDLLRDIQSGNVNARGLLDIFLNEESPREEPAPTSAPALPPLSTGTTTAASVTAEATAITSTVRGSTGANRHEEVKNALCGQLGQGDTGLEDVDMAEVDGCGDDGGAREGGGCESLGGVDTVAVGVPGSGNHTPCAQEGVPPSLPSTSSTPTTHSSSADSLESQTTCPKSEIASMTPSTHASSHTSPVSSQ